MKIFQIGAFFRLVSDWFQTGFILAQIISDCVFRFQIASDCFRLLQTYFRLASRNIFQTGSLKHFRLVLVDCSLKNCLNFIFCLHISDCFRFVGIGSSQLLLMRLPPHRRRNMPPPQTPKRRRICDGTT